VSGLEKEEQEYNGKCEECNTVFNDNFIVYKCGECNKCYCFTCFCKSHYEKHKTRWLEYEIKKGKPIKPREPSGSLKV